MSGTWSEPASSRSDVAEQKVKFAALDSFSRYQRTAHYNVTHRRRQNFYALPQAHWQLLSKPPFNILEKFNRVDDAIEENARIAREIVVHSFEAFGIAEDSSEWRDTAKPPDLDKARSTLRQLYRDWSAEGSDERKACFGPVLGDLGKLYGGVEGRDGVKVLIPGAGLGRLVVEICAMGFEVEGNELSFHQLMASNWVLNGTKPGHTHTLYPWALSFSNQPSREDQLRGVQIPDVHPGAYLHEASEGKPRHAFERMGMSAADFCTLYAQPDQRDAFDVIVTVYFVDTAPNLIRYIEAILNTLKVGGHWINLGPLLWHFEDRAPNTTGDATSASSDSVNSDGQAKGIEESGAVELTRDEVVQLVEHMGFKVKELATEQPQGYIQDTRSMISTSYQPLHFVATKNE